MGVSSPRINQLSIEDSCFFNALIPRFIVFSRIKLLCPVGRSLHVDDAFVASVAQLDRAPGSLIEKRLPNLVCDIGLSVHHATIANQHALLVGVQRCLEKDILKNHLRLHEINLELDSISECHLLGLNEAPTLHHQRGCLGHHEHLETLGLEFLCD